MTDSIVVKMKLADPAEVERMMKLALAETGLPDMQLDGGASVCVRAIHSALAKSGCVIIQVDNGSRDD